MWFPFAREHERPISVAADLPVLSYIPRERTHAVMSGAYIGFRFGNLQRNLLCDFGN